MSPFMVHVGYRFALRNDVRRFPDFIARKGMIGTVTHTQRDGLIVAKMDEPVEGGKFWDNDLWWYGSGPQFELDTEPLSQPTETPQF